MFQGMKRCEKDKFQEQKLLASVSQVDDEEAVKEALRSTLGD